MKITKPLSASDSCLTFRKRGESLRQVEKFFLCVRAVMSMHVRSMCIKTLEDFIVYMRTYVVSRWSYYYNASLSFSLFPIIVTKCGA